MELGLVVARGPDSSLEVKGALVSEVATLAYRDVRSAWGCVAI